MPARAAVVSSVGLTEFRRSAIWNKCRNTGDVLNYAGRAAVLRIGAVARIAAQRDVAAFCKTKEPQCLVAITAALLSQPSRRNDCDLVPGQFFLRRLTSQ